MSPCERQANKRQVVTGRIPSWSPAFITYSISQKHMDYGHPSLQILLTFLKTRWHSSLFNSVEAHGLHLSFRTFFTFLKTHHSQVAMKEPYQNIEIVSILLKVLFQTCCSTAWLQYNENQSIWFSLILSSIRSHNGFSSDMHKLNPMHFRQLIRRNRPGGEQLIKLFKTKDLPLKNPTVCGACVETGTSNKIILQKVSQLLLVKGAFETFDKGFGRSYLWS